MSADNDPPKDTKSKDTKDEAAEDSHTLDDHLFGAYFPHDHGPDADHDHDEFDLSGPIEDNPIWLQDNVTLNSVGIDIGSSGTQIVFSRVHMRRLGEELTSRYFVVSRDTLYQSPVALTPYQGERIDDVALGVIIDAAYNEAGIQPKDIDAGAVILTGEALRRENAKAISEIVSSHGGEFVCATAGHHMEAMLAGYGSGAAALSREEDKRILNIDIGGGTTKLAIVEGGRITATAAFHVGGRLLVVDNAMKITRLEPAGKHHAARAGFEWSLGDTVTDTDLDTLAESMADTIVSALGAAPLADPIERLYLTPPIADFGVLDAVMFSGGVAEFVYDRESRDFGDMGRRLGHAIARRAKANAFPASLHAAGQCIRATALGASEYSVQLSGNTSYISNPTDLLPRRNLQVVQPPFTFTNTFTSPDLAHAITEHLTAFDLDSTTENLALAFKWQGHPAYGRIRAFADGIKLALEDRFAAKQAMHILLDGDIAMTLGTVLQKELGVESPLLVIDGVSLWDFDFIDLGRIRLPSYTVPVTIKSLVFNDDPRTKGDLHKLQFQADDHGHEHGHGHNHDHDHDHSHQHKTKTTKGGA